MNSKPRVENPVSAGGVVYQTNGGRLETVLCGRLQPVRWSLAKGTPDPGESLEQTALREVREETGLEVRIDGSLGSIDYWFADRGKGVRYHKTVHFFLMVAVGGTTDQHDPEFDVVQWFDAQDALKTLAYDNEVKVLQRALTLIAERDGAESGEGT
ncbi:MAG: NUDIX hydrolase [Chloroflexi bacterium]|nr:NUDIX hydrolase [Chloroflexota bacterium]MCI0788521.1 NUDIX hydrolase [Chloroflexota bacterium]MCI0829887.1 NUDIX hydrolase [Chloroflexota bacterium]MCI0898932.1 NUDIX hydrolase [Chloroflexota bacterium]MCI0903184.1 NUDIX hydrolase [Chloroflexota bacterium]